MIIPDINLLVYAYNGGAPYHDSARAWWEGLMYGMERVGIPWVVSVGFVRLITHPKVIARPSTTTEAVDYVFDWFRLPHVTTVNPGAGHRAPDLFSSESRSRRRRWEPRDRRPHCRPLDGVSSRGALPTTPTSAVSLASAGVIRSDRAQPAHYGSRSACVGCRVEAVGLLRPLPNLTSPWWLGYTACIPPGAVASFSMPFRRDL